MSASDVSGNFPPLCSRLSFYPGQVNREEFAAKRKSSATLKADPVGKQCRWFNTPGPAEEGR